MTPYESQTKSLMTAYGVLLAVASQALHDGNEEDALLCEDAARGLINAFPSLSAKLAEVSR